MENGRSVHQITIKKRCKKMNTTKFVEALKYPFKKLDQGFGVLVDAVLPDSAQKFIADKRSLIYSTGVMVAVVSIAAAPAAVPALIAGALTFNFIADYCDEHTRKRNSQQQAAQPIAETVNQSPAASEDSNFKPNALSPDFKSAQVKAAPEAANSNLSPGDQPSISKPANRAP
jgi:hypothetical protein